MANKRNILQAAEKCFAQFGFKGTAVQKIADEANLPKTNVLYYFKTKQELYVAPTPASVSLNLVIVIFLSFTTRLASVCITLSRF